MIASEHLMCHPDESDIPDVSVLVDPGSRIKCVASTGIIEG
jgi:hypothetical protein